jgi:beta-phosphoglucomutase-like phosphatase (HAD superfamily)
MDAEEFVFGVDLDGVVADFIQGFKPIVAEWLGVPIASLTDEVSYGFREWNLGTSYDDVHRFALKERDLFANLPLIEGSASALRRLSSTGIRIRIITHRLYIPWFHRQAVVQTLEWLEKHGVPYWDLCFMASKSSVDANVYVEDSPANIQALRSAGKEVMVFRNSTNRDLAPPGTTQWKEVEQWVMSKYTDWTNKQASRRPPGA